MKLLSKYDVAEMFSCTPSAAVKLMKLWKVPTIYLGPGRGLGYRWREQDVLASLNTREVGTEAKRPKSKPKSKEYYKEKFKKFF
jgi:hypothetical protein